MEYRGCVDTCRDVRTCATAFDDLDDTCEGRQTFVGMCVCKDGFVMQGDRCIPVDDCGCQVIDENGSSSGIWVPDGYWHMTKDCKTIYECKDNVFTIQIETGNHCGDTEICKVKDDEEGQCIEDPDDGSIGYCRGTGDPHFQTFDGLRYDYMGLCWNRFLEVTETTNPEEVPPFAIHTKHRRSWAPRNEVVSMTEWVEFHIYSQLTNWNRQSDPQWTIRIAIVDSPADRTGDQQGVGRPGGAEITVINNVAGTQFKTPEVKTPDFHAVNFQNQYVSVTTWFGVEIKFTVNNWGLEAFVPSKYRTLTEGLCGNWNGNREDDMEGCDGILRNNVNDMAHSCRVDLEEEECEQDSVIGECNDRDQIEEQCELITSGDAFETCRADFVDPSGNYQPTA